VTTNWGVEQAHRDAAADFAEEIVKGLGITAPPVSPFEVIRSEKGRIRAFGDDFGDAFDGRLEYHAPRFLLFYNTKYDAWPHRGKHHPKVNFTIAHELGHFLLTPHRKYLKKGGRPHGSQVEFTSDNLSEGEADAFAAGLLMPRFLADKVVNHGPGTLKSLQAAKDLFDVSLTSMMVRWVQMSDYPCAMCSVRDGKIEWGLTSEPLKKAGAYRVHRGKPVASRSARAFLDADPSLTRYREGEGWAVAERWLDFNRDGVGVVEYLVVIPSVRQLLVFLTAEEDDVFPDTDND
jgi:Zn-dependent peptidase ImmA (M78 family)